MESTASYTSDWADQYREIEDVAEVCMCSKMKFEAVMFTT